MEERGPVAQAAAGAQYPGGLRFFPAERQQALRVRRYLMAAGTSLLVPVALFLGHGLGLMPLDIALQGTVVILALLALFYLLLRSGLNLRFGDPSLTTEMIGAAILYLAWIMYHAPAARDSLSLFYPVALLFGVLRLNTVRLLGIAVLALVAHATVVLFSFLRDPLMDLGVAYTQLAVLFIVLPWFALMGGYVNSLRHRLSDSNRQLREAYGRIADIAVHDELTGLYNRRFLLEFLEREAARAHRFGSSFSVCMLDIDHFKSINDSQGHGAGDAVLKHFAAVAAIGMRSVDVFGRLGGEEFLVVMPNTEIPGAVTCAERIRHAVEQSAFPGLPPGRPVTVTAGVARRAAQEAPSVLLARADGALYSGKAAGRNRVVAIG